MFLSTRSASRKKRRFEPKEARQGGNNAPPPGLFLLLEELSSFTRNSTYNDNAFGQNLYAVNSTSNSMSFSLQEFFLSHQSRVFASQTRGHWLKQWDRTNQLLLLPKQSIPVSFHQGQVLIPRRPAHGAEGSWQRPIRLYQLVTVRNERLYR